MRERGIQNAIAHSCTKKGKLTQMGSHQANSRVFRHHLLLTARVLDSVGALGYMRPRLGAFHSTLGSYGKTIFRGAQLIFRIEDKRIGYNLDPVLSSRRANGESRYAFGTPTQSKRHAPRFTPSLDRAKIICETNGIIVSKQSGRPAWRLQTSHSRSASMLSSPGDKSVISHIGCFASEACKVVQ
ncbi:hypothetical protein FHX12_003112 [Rhizobium sp. BK609]|nr:hypothetical protein [Rhizobium sp. BK098]MBB3616130.1 hypothetical protein [Rhizobium sp. BK609]MBB3681789.1 hypothetical protein [Rhizobium sp. BK612]